jgi:hypothetical protein
MFELNIVSDALRQGNWFAWVLFTLWNTALLTYLGKQLLSIYDDARDAARLRQWKRKYHYGVVAVPDPKPDTRARLTDFARELKELCNRNELNLEGVSSIVVTDRTLYEGHYWHAVFTGCDTRGVYNKVNAGWFE